MRREVVCVRGDRETNAMNREWTVIKRGGSCVCVYVWAWEVFTW